MKKDLFVPQSENAIKVYEQQNAIKKDCTLSRYYITKDYFNTHMKQFVAKAGDLIVSCAGTIGEVYELPKDAEEGVFNQALMRVRVNNEIVNKEIFITVFSSMIDKFSKIYSNGSAIKNIPPFADLKRTQVYLPCKEEQIVIAQLLRSLDERIATQSKIIEKLQSLIKGICNNYFEKLSVQENANLIRLSDVLKERNEYSSKDGKFIHGTLSKDGIFPKTGRWDRDFLVKQEDKKYKVTHLDDICYNPANLKFGVICRNTFGDLIFSPIYVTFEVCKNVNIGFMELYLTNHNFIEKVRRFEQGTVYERMAVSPEDFLSYKIRIPSYSDQTFFYKKVQWLITLSQNEMKLLSQYKKLRQYLLRQMFI